MIILRQVNLLVNSAKKSFKFKHNLTAHHNADHGDAREEGLRKMAGQGGGGGASQI